MPLSVGVKVTDCWDVPADGAVLGVVKSKVPFTLALPMLKIELLNDCPKVIELAVGALIIDVVAFDTVTLTLAVVVV